MNTDTLKSKLQINIRFFSHIKYLIKLTDNGLVLEAKRRENTCFQSGDYTTDENVCSASFTHEVFFEGDVNL